MGDINIPPELLDHIFSHLHYLDWETSWDHSAYGKYALDSCTRVCHSWSDVARPHLFRDVVYSFRPVPYSVALNDDGEYPKDISTYECFDSIYKKSARFKTLPMFYAFLQQNAMAQNSIRRLRLDAWPRGSSAFFNDHDGVDADIFRDLLQLLPRLRVLHLTTIS